MSITALHSLTRDLLKVNVLAALVSSYHRTAAGALFVTSTHDEGKYTKPLGDGDSGTNEHV